MLILVCFCWLPLECRSNRQPAVAQRHRVGGGVAGAPHGGRAACRDSQSVRRLRGAAAGVGRRHQAPDRRSPVCANGHVGRRCRSRYVRSTALPLIRVSRRIGPRPVVQDNVEPTAGEPLTTGRPCCWGARKGGNDKGFEVADADEMAFVAVTVQRMDVPASAATTT